MSRAIIQAVDIRKSFGEERSEVIALDGVSLDLFCGELTLLMGPSGSGKSSLIAALGGLQAPDSGAVIFDGLDLWGRASSDVMAFRRQNCGYVFQSGGLFSALTALDQIAIPLTYLGFDKNDATSRAIAVLEEVGLGGRLDARPGEMSGGQNQRVAIARMLAKNPKLMFCDEPTSSLDGEAGARIAVLLREAAVSRNTMVLCVTHDSRLMPFADRVIKMNDGVLIGHEGGALDEHC